MSLGRNPSRSSSDAKVHELTCVSTFGGVFGKPKKFAKRKQTSEFLGTKKNICLVKSAVSR